MLYKVWRHSMYNNKIKKMNNKKNNKIKKWNWIEWLNMTILNISPPCNSKLIWTQAVWLRYSQSKRLYLMLLIYRVRQNQWMYMLTVQRPRGFLKCIFGKFNLPTMFFTCASVTKLCNWSPKMLYCQHCHQVAGNQWVHSGNENRCEIRRMKCVELNVFCKYRRLHFQ